MQRQTYGHLPSRKASPGPLAGTKLYCLVKGSTENEIRGPNYTTYENEKTWKRRTNLQDMKMQDMKLQDMKSRTMLDAKFVGLQLAVGRELLCIGSNEQTVAVQLAKI